MGDRGNIVVDRNWLYTHWGGSNLKPTLQKALERGKERWRDSSYLTRIIFCDMVGEKMFDQTTGYGISMFMVDNENNILVVDTQTQQVEEYTTDNYNKSLGDKLNTWSFKEFIKEDFEVD